jgi:hypothetical protein
MRPAVADYPEYFHKYVSLVPEDDVLPVLESQIALVDALPSRAGDKETFAYAPGKWSVRELLGHLGDGERVFGYRALTFSRFDAASLPGFDEVTWTPHGHFGVTALRDLADEFVALRRANLQMLQRLEEPQWQAGGRGDGKPITVRALAYVMAGHVRHHLGILRDRYAIAQQP